MTQQDRLLTPVELEVMILIWARKGGTVRDVLADLPKERDLAYTSISTVLRILERKGFLQSNKEGRTHRYIPLVEQDEYETTNVKSLVKRLFRGDPLALVRSLVRAESLSEEDLRQMQELVESQLED